VKKAVAWVAGLVGIAALGRWLAQRSRSRRADVAVAPAPAGDPATELRRRLDETRDAQAPATASGETAVTAGSIEERRAAVHRQAEDAIAAMRESGL